MRGKSPALQLQLYISALSNRLVSSVPDCSHAGGVEFRLLRSYKFPKKVIFAPVDGQRFQLPAGHAREQTGKTKKKTW